MIKTVARFTKAIDFKENILHDLAEQWGSIKGTILAAPKTSIGKFQSTWKQPGITGDTLELLRVYVLCTGVLKTGNWPVDWNTKTGVPSQLKSRKLLRKQVTQRVN